MKTEKSKNQIKFKKLIDYLNEEKLNIPVDIPAELERLRKHIEKTNSSISSTHIKGKIKGVFSKNKKQKSDQKEKDLEDKCQQAIIEFNNIYDFYVKDSYDSSVKSKIDKIKTKLSKIKLKSKDIDVNKKDSNYKSEINFGKNNNNFKNYNESIKFIKDKLDEAYATTDDLEKWKRELKDRVDKNAETESLTIQDSAKAALKQAKKAFKDLEYVTARLRNVIRSTHFKGNKYRKQLDKQYNKVSIELKNLNTKKNEFFNNCNRIIKFGEYTNDKDQASVSDFSPVIKLYVDLIDHTDDFIDSLYSRTTNINKEGISVIDLQNRYMSSFNKLKNAKEKFDRDTKNTGYFKFQENRNNRAYSLNKASTDLNKITEGLNAKQGEITKLKMEFDSLKYDYKKEHSALGYTKKILKIMSSTMQFARSALELVKSVSNLAGAIV